MKDTIKSFILYPDFKIRNNNTHINNIEIIFHYSYNNYILKQFLKL